MRCLIQPTDTVGVKSNVWGKLPTPPALEEAIRKEVLAVGVEANRFSVDDRGVRRNPVFKKSTALINVRPMRPTITTTPAPRWARSGSYRRSRARYDSISW